MHLKQRAATLVYNKSKSKKKNYARTARRNLLEVVMHSKTIMQKCSTLTRIAIPEERKRNKRGGFHRRPLVGRDEFLPTTQKRLRRRLPTRLHATPLT